MTMLKELFKNRLLGASSAYLFSNVIEKGIPFIVLPILAKYLSTAEFGIISIVVASNLLICLFISLSVSGILSVEYFKRDLSQFNRLLSNCYLIVLASFLLLLLSYKLWSGYASTIASVDPKWLLFLIVSGLGTASCEILLTLFRTNDQPIKFGLFQVTKTLIDTVLSLFLIVKLEWGWEGRVAALIFANILMGSFAYIYILFKFKLKFEPNTADLKKIISFCLPLLPHALGGWILSVFDRYLISQYRGLDEVGIYSVGYNFGLIVSMIAYSFNQAWSPFLFKNLAKNDGESNKKIVRITYMYFVGILVIAGLISICGNTYINLFLADSFVESKRYVGIICLAYAFQGMYYMVNNYIFYVEKTYFLSATTLTVGMLHIVLSYFFLEKFGTIGAAYATLVSQLSFFLVIWAISIKLYPMPWRLSKSI